MGAAGADVSVLAGEGPDDQLEHEQDDQREQRRCPRTGGRVQPSQPEGSEAGEEVAEALRHGRDMAGVVGVRGPPDDEGQGQADRRALPHAEQRHPRIGPSHGDDQQAGESGPDEDGGCGHADPPRSQPSGDRGSDEAGQDRGEGGEGQHPARPVRGHAAVLEDRGNPGQRRVVAHRLQSHEAGDRPGDGVGEDRPEGRFPALAGRVRRVRSGGASRVREARRAPHHLRDPQQSRQYGRDRPDPQRPAPGSADDGHHRHRQSGGERRPEEQRRRVQTHHQPGTMGEVALDRRRQQHIADGDGRAHEHGAGEEREQARLQSQADAGGEDDHEDPEHPMHAEPACQGGGEERERAEGEDRNRRQQTAHRGAETGIAEDVPEHRPHRGDTDAQVETDEDQSRPQDQQTQPTPTAAGRHSPRRFDDGHALLGEAEVRFGVRVESLHVVLIVLGSLLILPHSSGPCLGGEPVN